jgi:uncharacterized protein
MRLLLETNISIFIENSETLNTRNMKNKKIIIAGGTGFIGQALAARFGKDNHVIILSRHAVNAHNNAGQKALLTPATGYNITYWRWDGKHVEKHWADEIDGSHLVINLSGKSVNCRYNRKNKKEIFDSRTDSTRAIGQAIAGATIPPVLWINAASATIYRHAEDRPQDEYTGEFHNDFSVQVCQLWEKTFMEQRTPFTRKAALRMAITLGAGGVMIPYLNLLKFGLGGRQGSGRQMYSWVHIEDLGRAIEWIFDHPELEGVFNVSSPSPVTNRDFMSTLRSVTGHRIGLPAWSWLLKLGATLIGTETELILKSRWVLPSRLKETGFTFRYEHPEEALKAIISQIPRKKYHLF